MFLGDWNFYWQLILVPLIICLTFGVLNRHFEELEDEILAQDGENAVINIIDELAHGTILSVDLSDRMEGYES